MREQKYTTEEEISNLRQEIKEAKLHYHHTGRISFSRLIKYFLYLIVVIVLSGILISVQMAKHSGKTPEILGYQFYKVMSGSMSPTLKIGSVIISKKPENASSLKVGDIITFKQDGTVVTHRIIEIVKENGIRYRTKGDNPNNSPDIELVSPGSIQAVYVWKLF